MTDQTVLLERIAAYLDGAMSDAEVELFEQEMARDPQLATEVERLASNDSLLREAFAETADNGIDDAFLKRMALGQLAPPTSPALPAAANDNSPFWRRWQVPLGAGIAAALALALTFTLRGGAAQSPVGLALEQTPSGQVATLDNGATITPVLSFKAGDGRFCREFTYAAASGERGAIACRNAKNWSVEAWGDGAATLPDPDEIALASGAGETSLDEAYASLGAGDPLQMSEENDLIAKGWK